MKRGKIKYSVFTPIYNEEGNIIPLYNEVKKVMDTLDGEWELLLVNDGSTDKSLDEILSIKDKRVRPITLEKNYGQSAAMDCGFRNVRGEYVISLDADLQNDPKDIPKLLEKLENKKEHYDVVCGWRHKRKDPLWMLIITNAAKFLRRIFVSDTVHDSGCTLRVYRRRVIEDLELWGEMHRYIVAILRWKGARIGEIKVNHRPRVNGVTKYSWNKSFKGLVDLFYVWFWKKFSSRPLHFLGVNGIILMILGFLSGLWTVFIKIFLGVDLSENMWLILTFFLFFIGFQLFVSGIILDILIKDYYNTSFEKRYKVRDIVDIRVINNIKDGSGSLIDSQNDVGSWPELEKNTRYFLIPMNPDKDSDNDGYTNLEERLQFYSYDVEIDNNDSLENTSIITKNITVDNINSTINKSFEKNSNLNLLPIYLITAVVVFLIVVIIYYVLMRDEY